MACEGARSSSQTWTRPGRGIGGSSPGRVVETWCEQRLFPLGSPGRGFHPHAQRRAEDAEHPRAARRTRGFDRRLAGPRSLRAHNRAVRGHCDGPVGRRLVVEASPGVARHGCDANHGDTPPVGVSRRGLVPRERTPERRSPSAHAHQPRAYRGPSGIRTTAEEESSTHRRREPRGHRSPFRATAFHRSDSTAHRTAGSFPGLQGFGHEHERSLVELGSGRERRLDRS